MLKSDCSFCPSLLEAGVLNVHGLLSGYSLAILDKLMDLVIGFLFGLDI